MPSRWLYQDPDDAPSSGLSMSDTLYQDFTPESDFGRVTGSIEKPQCHCFQDIFPLLFTLTLTLLDSVNPIYDVVKPLPYAVLFAGDVFLSSASPEH